MTATVVVSGALANKPGNGGEAWVVLSWVRGLARLGFDVWFVEELHDGIDAVDAVSWFTCVVAEHGLADRSVLLVGEGTVGALGPDAVADLVGGCDLLVNISGTLRRPVLLRTGGRRAFIDLDPGYTQSWWRDDPSAAAIAAHHLHFTVGENIGRRCCPIPTAGIHWLACRQPVVLDDWPVSAVPVDGAFTTVSTWRAPFGPPTIDGVTHLSKHHMMRAIVSLPSDTGERFRVATSMHDTDHPDRTRFADAGWQVVDAARTAPTPDAFRQFVRDSAAECSATQGVYTANTGWFSDRSVRYLATGRAVVVQDTGCDAWLPIGEGVLTFRDARGAAAAVAAVVSDPDAHGAAARALAERHFESDGVLGRFVDRCGIGS